VVNTLGPRGLLVFGLAFSPDGGRLAAFSSDGMVVLYDATRWGGKLLEFPAHRISVRGNLAFSRDGRRLVLPGDKNTVNIWDVPPNGKREVSAPQLTLRDHTAQVWGVAFSPDGRWVASGGEDNTVKLWNAEAGGEPIRTFRGHGSVVSRVAFSPDGKRLASASFDRTIKVWDLTNLGKEPEE
jgi:WD40 repeat protein